MPGTSNSVCLAQGSIHVFASLASAYWFLCLALNVHLIIIWKVSIRWPIIVCYHVISWGGPLAAVVVLNVKGLISYNGISCSVAPTYSLRALVIPVAVAVFLSFLLNVITFARVTVVARSLQANIKSVLALQFRPMLYSVAAAVALIISLSLSALGTAKLQDQTWIPSWLICVAEGAGQTACSQIAAPHFLTIGQFVVVGIFDLLVGVLTFVFFGTKEDVLTGWANLFRKPASPVNSSTSSRP